MMIWLTSGSIVGNNNTRAVMPGTADPFSPHTATWRSFSSSNSAANAVSSWDESDNKPRQDGQQEVAIPIAGL